MHNTSRTHTHTHTDTLGLRNGPVMWPQRCGLLTVSPPYRTDRQM